MMRQGANGCDVEQSAAGPIRPPYVNAFQGLQGSYDCPVCVKDGVARALRTLRAATSPELNDRVVPLSAQMIGLRFTAAVCGRRRRESGNRALGAGRAGVGVDEPERRVDHGPTESSVRCCSTSTSPSCCRPTSRLDSQLVPQQPVQKQVS